MTTSLLSRAIPARTRATKGIDQEAEAATLGGVYLPLEDRSTFTERFAEGDAAALNVATFYACVRVLSEGIASLPMILYRRLPGGGKERATDHELYRVFHDAPNPSMTSFVWRELVMSQLVTWGNSYNEITFDAFGQMQLWPIRPDRIEPRWAPSDGPLAGTKLFDYLSPRGGRTTLAPGSVFHIPALSATGLKGYSPVALHRKTLALHNAARDYGLNTFRNNARPAVVLSHPKNLSNPAIERLATQMDELRGSRNAGKTVILEEGLTVTEVGIPPKDAQYIESRTNESRELMRIMRMQPHKVGDLERATFSNIHDQNQEHIDDTLRPWAVRIEQEAQLQLIRDDQYFTEILFDGLLRGSPKERAEALQIRRQNGTLNADQWREYENENPLPDGLGKTFWMPVNMQPVTDQTQGDQAVPDQGTQLAPVPMALQVAGKVAGVRCSNAACGKLLAEQATAPFRFTCRACKSVTEAPGPETVSISDAVDGLKAAIRSLAEPPTVTVEPAEAPVVHVHTDSFAEAVREFKTMLAAPKTHRVLRNDEGKIVGIEAA